jgi:hypothetical protein
LRVPEPFMTESSIPTQRGILLPMRDRPVEGCERLVALAILR